MKNNQITTTFHINLFSIAMVMSKRSITGGRIYKDSIFLVLEQGSKNCPTCVRTYVREELVVVQKCL